MTTEELYRLYNLIQDLRNLLKKYSEPQLQSVYDSYVSKYYKELDKYESYIGRKCIIADTKKPVTIIEISHVGYDGIIVKVQYDNKGIDTYFLTDLKDKNNEKQLQIGL